MEDIAQINKTPDVVEDPVVVAQRFFNIFRQMHIFNQAKKDEFNEQIKDISPEVRKALTTIPGGGMLLEYIEEKYPSENGIITKTTHRDLSPTTNTDAIANTNANPVIIQSSGTSKVVLDDTFNDAISNAIKESQIEMSKFFSQNKPEPVYIIKDSDLTNITTEDFKELTKTIKQTQQETIAWLAKNNQETINISKDLSNTVKESQIEVARMIIQSKDLSTPVVSSGAGITSNSGDLKDLVNTIKESQIEVAKMLLQNASINASQANNANNIQINTAPISSQPSAEIGFLLKEHLTNLQEANKNQLKELSSTLASTIKQAQEMSSKTIKETLLYLAKEKASFSNAPQNNQTQIQELSKALSSTIEKSQEKSSQTIKEALVHISKENLNIIKEIVKTNPVVNIQSSNDDTPQQAPQATPIKSYKKPKKNWTNGPDKEVILTAQRFFNLFRQSHLFNKKRKNEFETEILLLPEDIKEALTIIPGGGRLLEYIDEKLHNSNLTVTENDLPEPIKEENKAPIITEPFIEPEPEPEPEPESEPEPKPESKAEESTEEPLIDNITDFDLNFDDFELELEKLDNHLKDIDPQIIKETPITEEPQKKKKKKKKNKPLYKSVINWHGFIDDNKETKETTENVIKETSEPSEDKPTETTSPAISLEEPKTTSEDKDTTENEQELIEDKPQQATDNDYEWELVEDTTPQNNTEEDYEWELVEDENSENEEWEYALEEEIETASKEDYEWEYVEEQTPETTNSSAKKTEDEYEWEYVEEDALNPDEEYEWEYVEEA